MRLEIEKDRRGARLPPRVSDGIPEDLRFIRIEWGEVPAVPVCLKLSSELLQNVRHVLGGDLQVPFEATCHRRVGHIGGPDVGGGEAGVSPEVVGLGVKPSSFDVVGDAHGCVRQPRQPLYSLRVGGTHVGRRDDAKLPTALRQFLKA